MVCCSKERKYITCSRADSVMLLELARHNRKHPTQAEAAAWDMLREGFPDVKFRRQHVVDGYIVDFICLSHQLVIEIDGGYHNDPEQKAEDEKRTQYLQQKGLTVLRFTNEEIIQDCDNVKRRIRNFLIKELI